MLSQLNLSSTSHRMIAGRLSITAIELKGIQVIHQRTSMLRFRSTELFDAEVKKELSWNLSQSDRPDAQICPSYLAESNLVVVSWVDRDLSYNSEYYTRQRFLTISLTVNQL